MKNLESRIKLSHTVFYIAIFLLLYSYFWPVKQASAHILQYSGSIGAVLHMDPEDDPIAGQQSTGFLEFKDRNNKFTLNNCNCQLTITENGKQILNQPLIPTDPSSNTAVFSVTFPSKDVYQINITGKPIGSTQFNNFILNYDVRVARETNSNTQTNSSSSPNWFQTNLVYIIGGFLITVLLIFALMKQKRV